MNAAEQQAIKVQYRVKNWREYNKALENRYSMTFWFDEETAYGWYESAKPSEPGRPKTYSDTAIACGLIIKSIFRLPLRGMKGFLSSIFQVMELPLKVPDISRFSRRQADLEIELPQGQRKESLHVVVDSSGLKIHGDGEWNKRKHGGTSRRRKWRKMHIAVDENSKEITASLLTDSSAGDGAQLPDLLDQTPDNVHQVSADGAYDSQACHEAVARYGATATTPPRKNTKLEWEDWDKDTEDQRKELRKEIVRLGPSKWKQLSGYHRRSLAENAFFRFKTSFGVHLSARRDDNQLIEAKLKCSILNKFTALGMPKSCPAMV
ncbi:IS5 family transposase [Magnetococcales bacterium HHB-1]